MTTISQKTKRKTATATQRNAEAPHIRTLRISEKYSIQFHPDGRRDALLEGNPWLSLDKNTLCWELISYLIAKEENHSPNCTAAP